jgi:hypothetical protein
VDREECTRYSRGQAEDLRRRSHPASLTEYTFVNRTPGLLLGNEKLCKHLRLVAQFTFAHDTLMWFVGTFHPILELAGMRRQSFSDEVCASWNV